MNEVNEHEIEPVPGLPEHLPEGERLLWQGAPRWQALAVRALHVRKVIVYFALLMAWHASSAISAGESPLRALGGTVWLGMLGLLAVGVLSLIAWQAARSTLYTLTNRRIVMRFGIALPMSLNLPFTVVQSASLRVHADGTSDIPVCVVKGARIGYLINWPHVRPWHLARPQPMLRGIADGHRVADLLASSLSAALGGERKPLVAPAAPATAQNPIPEVSAAA